MQAQEMHEHRQEKKSTNSDGKRLCRGLYGKIWRTGRESKAETSEKKEVLRYANR